MGFLKRHFIKLRLRIKLLILNSLIYGITLLIASGFWLAGVHDTNQSLFHHRIDIQASVVAGNLNAALIFNDVETIEEVLATLDVDSAILSVTVLDRDRKVVAKRLYNQTKPEPRRFWPQLLRDELHRLKTTISLERQEVGVLLIEASSAEVLSATENAMIAVVLVLLGSLMLTALLSQRGLRWLLGPVEQLSRLVSEVKDKKDYSLRARVRYADEIGELADEFNAMLKMIEQRDQFLESEVSSRTAELAYQATHDLLTQLPNRRGLQQYLHKMLSYTHPKKKHAFLALDLDQFKVVNDTCGHIGGDQLLRSLSNVLKEQLEDGDFLARLGGDEFAIVLFDVDETSMVDKAEQIRKRIEDFTFHWEGLSFSIYVSIGALLFEPQEVELSTLLKNADAACFAAKDMGRNRVYAITREDQAMTERHAEMILVRELNSALVNDQFTLCRQPIKALSSRSSMQSCYEVLLRLKRQGEEELVKPDDFLPTANRFGLSTNIDTWVVRTVVGHLQRVYYEGVCKPVYWVNLSTTSLKDEHFIDFLYSILSTANLPKKTLVFEITETGFIESLNLVTEHMHRIRELGFEFALDDFGSGASSFKGLKQLPLDYLKIDGSFICNLANSDTDLIVTRSIIEIASSMNLEIVAEHVEDQKTLKLITELGVDYAQGWALGMPITIESP